MDEFRPPSSGKFFSMNIERDDRSLILRLVAPIFQQGFQFETRLGVDVRAILTSELDLEPELVDRRVATVFINGKAVDDFQTACLTAGCALTLSGAMPGLVGACLRKSGKYASLRSVISYVPEEMPQFSGRGIIKIKLFNTLIPELGPLFLSRGILISPDQYDDLIASIERVDLESAIGRQIFIEPSGSDHYRIQVPTPPVC